MQVEFVPEALEHLAENSCDVVLLDIGLSEGRSVEAFRQIREESPGIPVILLTDTEEERHAISLIRQGAQDYLLKSEIDCLPLARSMRCAIERQRFRSALRSLSLIDDLTGLLTPGGFHKLAQTHCAVAKRLNASAGLHLFELEGLDDIREGFGHQERDMSLILTAEILRDAFGETGIIGRLNNKRLAVLSIDDDDLSGTAAEVRSRIEDSSRRRNGRCPLSARFAVARQDVETDYESMLETAQQALCENERNRTGQVRI
jgi:PleD family two-component response regulator